MSSRSSQRRPRSRSSGSRNIAVNPASTHRVVEDLPLRSRRARITEHQRSGVGRAELAARSHDLVGDQLAVVEEVDLVMTVDPLIHIDVERVMGTVDRLELGRSLRDRDRLRRIDRELARNHAPVLVDEDRRRDIRRGCCRRGAGRGRGKGARQDRHREERQDTSPHVLVIDRPPVILKCAEAARRPPRSLQRCRCGSTVYQLPPALQEPPPAGEHWNVSVPLLLVSVNSAVSVGDSPTTV